MKKLLLCAALLIVPVRAQAALILAGDAGGNLFCAVDNNVGGPCLYGTAISDLNPALGILDLGTAAIGGLTVEGSLHTANLGTPLLNSSSLSITNNTLAAITLNATIGATGFVGPADTAFTTGSGTFVNSTGSSTTYTWWNDALNRQSGQTATDRDGVLVDTFTHVAAAGLDSFSHNGGPFTVSDPALFSMALGFDLTLLGGDSLISRGQSITKELQAPIPEPGSLLLLGTGLALAGRRIRRRFARS